MKHATHIRRQTHRWPRLAAATLFTAACALLCMGQQCPLNGTIATFACLTAEDREACFNCVFCGGGDCPFTLPTADVDSDADGTPDACDGCPMDPNKTAAGDCGCGVQDVDADADGVSDCLDDDIDDGGNGDGNGNSNQVVLLIVRVRHNGDIVQDGTVSVARGACPGTTIACQGPVNDQGEFTCSTTTQGLSVCVSATCCEGAGAGTATVVVVNQGGGVMVYQLNI